MPLLPYLCLLFGLDLYWKNAYFGAALLLSFHFVYQLCMLCIAVVHSMCLILHFGRDSMHWVCFRLISRLFSPHFSAEIPLACLHIIFHAIALHMPLPRFPCPCAHISRHFIFIHRPLMWVWLRLSHVSISPCCILYAILAILHCVCHCRALRARVHAFWGTSFSSIGLICDCGWGSLMLV